MNEPEASGKHGGPCYLDLPLRTFLGLLADGRPAPAGGAAAALGIALAASLCAMTARVSGRQLPEAAELAAEAERLADLVAPLAQADAEAYGAVIAARRRPAGPPPESGRAPGPPADLAAALSDAADVPMQIAEIGARIAALATRLAVHGHPNLHGDAVVAALLADAGTRSACALVRINLSGAGSDERLARVTRLLAALPPAPSG
jgi:methenyltetrahydrofolate cyclohydrolase